ncbi:MAG: 50S ribosomal protein L1 [Candidatus Daviesbacteria bacterium]|nr:MAG: 50S ribosomal protein L1 [Candidatus Daviesbacteria bacterium]
MGKTKTKIIDDSQPEAKKKKTSAKQKLDVGNEKIDEEVRDLKVETPTSNIQPPKPTSKVKHPTSKKVRSKKYQEISKDLDRSKSYPVSEAVDMVKKLSYSKFNGSLEAHIITAQTGVRGLISLPFASGRKIRVLAFGKNAPSSGADIVGDDSTLTQIEKGQINFDIIVTTPEWMAKLTKVAKILGPRGLMPNPKNGTITNDLKKALEGFQGGKTEFKTESKSPIIHLALGKLNQPTEELSANVRTLLQTLGKSKILKVSLAPTMGPSVKLDFSSF